LDRLTIIKYIQVGIIAFDGSLHRLHKKRPHDDAKYIQMDVQDKSADDSIARRNQALSNQIEADLVNMVRPGGFELPTFWFVAVAARRINNLAHGGGL
jgi:hypothetical protein